MDRTVDGYQQLAEKICQQLPDIKDLQFSRESWPPALEIPSEGIELGNLIKFVDNVFEDYMGSAGISALMDPFFAQIPTFQGVYLTRFEVDLNNSGDGAPFFIGFQLRESWQIISDSGLPNTPALVLSNPGFTIGSPGGEAGYMVDVYGTLEIFGVALQVMVQWPNMIITGTLVRELDLQTLLAETGFEGNVVFDDETTSLKIRAMLIRFDLNKKTFDITFGMGGWEILPDKLALNNLLLDLSISPEHKSASVRTQIALCGIDIDLSGKFKDGKLEFSGSTGPGQALPMGELIVWLNDLFGTGTDVPSAISSLTFNDLSLSFNTGEESKFTFKGSAALEAGDSQVTISIDIDVTGTEKKIGAQLIIGGEQFKVSFDNKKASTDDNQDYETALIALYEHDDNQGAAPNLHQMVDGLSHDLAQVVPAIEIHKAVFGYHKSKKDDKTESAWLFGIELGDVKFSIENSDQPIISALLGNELSFGVDSPQLLLTTQPLKQDVLAQLPSLGDKFELPKKDLNAACLSASLTLGGQKYPLLMNLGEGSEKTPDAQDATTPESQEGTSTDSDIGPDAEKPASAALTAQTDVVPSTPAGDVTWIKIQKQVSVLYFDKIGLRYKSGTIGLLLSASLKADGLTISLDGFSIESPLDKFKPTFDLSGLGIAYKADPIEISGAFLKNVQDNRIQYGGQALVKTESFMLSAIGSYSLDAQNNPSMFIFAFMKAQLGGPPCFFVTGLAAGFGYNSAVRTPAIEEVETFPLVAAMVNPDAIGGKDASPMKALEKLGDWVQPQPGSTWLAAGVEFTSFNMIESFALLAVSFGQRLEIGILGSSTIKIPYSGDKQLSEIKVAFKASYIPDDGKLEVVAQLTPDSYILSRDNHPTGGLAFCSWFAGEHTGDFVLSVGGYHSKFNVPAHYPQVPRLALSWKVNNQLSIKGDGYFALTPSVLMAGGYLEANWRSGSLEAWFKAQIDFLIAWNPFHYDATMHVNMSIAYTISINTLFVSWQKRLTAELGTDLHIWGPDFSGIAHIKVAFITFDIKFGGASSEPPAIGWDDFKESFLPDDILSVSVRNGLISSSNEENPAKDDLGIIDPKDFSLVIDSAIPVRNLNGNPAKYEVFGIAPMKINDFNTELVITIKRDGQDCTAEFEFTPIAKNVPAGLWGTKSNPDLNRDPLVRDVITGFVITVKPITESPVAVPSAGTADGIASKVLESRESSTSHVPTDHDIQEIIPSQPIPKEQELDLQWEQDLLVSTDLQVDPINIIQDSLKTANGRRQEMLAALGFESDVITIEDNLAEAFVAAPQIEG